VKVLAALWLAVIVLGIVAAIALPAYMGFAGAGL
jgi:Tfp pilus assembly protein PilE